MDDERFVLVRGRRVYVHSLVDGELQAEHELPFAIAVGALREAGLWFARQDGDLGCLDLGDSDLTTVSVH